LQRRHSNQLATVVDYSRTCYCHSAPDLDYLDDNPKNTRFGRLQEAEAALDQHSQGYLAHVSIYRQER
jgi:hypothetical protein